MTKLPQHPLEKFLRRDIDTALSLEQFSRDKKNNTKARRSRAFRIAQKIRAAHKVAV